MDKFVGTYVGSAQTDSAYGESLGHTVSMYVNLTLNADSTFKYTWDLDFNGWCRFDSPWYRTGKWTVKKDFLFFTLAEDYDEYYESGRRFFPGMIQEPETLTKREREMIFKFKQKHGEYVSYLKVENGSMKGLHAGVDCVEEVWKNEVITKI